MKLGSVVGCQTVSESHCEGPLSERARRFGFLELADVLLTGPVDQEASKINVT